MVDCKITQINGTSNVSVFEYMCVWFPIVISSLLSLINMYIVVSV